MHGFHLGTCLPPVLCLHPSRKYHSAPLSNGHCLLNTPRSSCFPQNAYLSASCMSFGGASYGKKRNEYHQSCMALYRFVLPEKIALGALLPHGAPEYLEDGRR